MKSQRKIHISTLCDAEQYEPVVAECLSETQAKKLPARHLSNGLALFAELILIHYDGIAEAFETNNGVELSIKLSLAASKDEMKLAYKPVSEVKDSAQAMVPDPDQMEIPGMERTPARKSGPVVVDADVVPALPPPSLALPAPEKTEEEKAAYNEGRAAAAEGTAYSANPHAFKSPEWIAWAEGWTDENDDLDPPSDTLQPLDTREDLTDHDEEE